MTDNTNTKILNVKTTIGALDAATQGRLKYLNAAVIKYGRDLPVYFKGNQYTSAEPTALELANAFNATVERVVKNARGKLSVEEFNPAVHNVRMFHQAVGGKDIIITAKFRDEGKRQIPIFESGSR